MQNGTESFCAPATFQRPLLLHLFCLLLLLFLPFSCSLQVGGCVNDDIQRARAVAKELNFAEGDTLVCDANRGWRRDEAARVTRALHDVDTYIEQPCNSYEECLSVRQHATHPFILDESIDCVEALLRAHQDKAMDAFNLKISKVGGLTRARQVRFLLLSWWFVVVLYWVSSSL